MDLSQGVTGRTDQALLDYGADVIKVERPGWVECPGGSALPGR